MKLDVSKLKEMPKNIGTGFCVYGTLPEEIKDWISFHGLKTESEKSYTNILISDEFSVDNLFIDAESYTYVDGFSPNLNKHLHFGHASNFVLAKAFQKLGIGRDFVATLGDTLQGEVTKGEAFSAYIHLCRKFDYVIDEVFFASDLEYFGNIAEGTGGYENTKVFDIEGTKVVGIKSDGTTSYFYQDVALAQKLSAKTLYLTGLEQEEHFKLLSKMYDTVHHLPLGLVTVNGEKMSSRLGNVIMFEDALNIFREKLGDNDKLVWNVLSGYILKSLPSKLKAVDLNQLDNVRMSSGLYLSYTLAKIKSAGLEINDIQKFNSFDLQVKHLKAKAKLQPNILFESIVDKAKEISSLYETLEIKGRKDNQLVYKPLAEDLLFGMKQLGLYDVDKV